MTAALKILPKKTRRKKAIRQAWHRGRLKYLLHSGQKVIDSTFLNIHGQLFVGNIARQFGKSFWAVSKACEQALKRPRSRIKYGTAYQTDLTEFILPTFEAVLADCPDSIKPKYKVQGSKWVFPNGSEIKLVGLDKTPNSLRGNVIDLIIIDEAGFVENLWYIYSSIIIPATLHRPNCKIIFISTPPSTPAHSFGTFIEIAEMRQAYVKLDIYQNPLITEADIERMAEAMGGKTSTTFRRECLCELILDSDLAIIPEWDDKYFYEIPRDEYYGYYHKYVGLDLGVKDFTACIFGYWHFKKALLYVEDEFFMNGPSMNTEILVAAIRAKESEIWGEGENKEVPKNVPFRRISDNNWPIMMQDFTSIHNLTFIMTTKDLLEAMINEVRLLVQSGQLVISPKCKFLRGCLKYGVWDKNKKKFAQSITYGHFDHLAALVYLVRNLAKNSNPIPIDHGKENHTHWMGHIKDRRNTNPNALALQKALQPKKANAYDTLLVGNNRKRKY